MNIWIDITNSPHVNFFDHMIRDLKSNHEIIITCRHLANTVELLDLFNLAYQVVGKHYGQSKVKKASGFLIRILQLFNYLKDKSIDVGISHSSFYSPVVSKLLGVPSIYLNDNEYAAGNKISFLFADKIMVPEFLSKDKVRRQWARYEKIIQYPGLKEGIYLWNFNNENSNDIFLIDKNKRKTIFIRPEPWTAQYYKGSLNFIDELLLDLKEQYNVILLPRGEAQANHYRNEKFKGIFITEKSISLESIIKNCDLFIGAGGTMTREAAVLGMPTISIYQDDLLDVDMFLIENGFMEYKKKLNAEFVRQFMDKMDKRNPERELMDKGRQAYELIKSTLISLH